MTSVVSGILAASSCSQVGVLVAKFWPSPSLGVFVAVGSSQPSCFALISAASVASVASVAPADPWPQWHPWPLWPPSLCSLCSLFGLRGLRDLRGLSYLCRLLLIAGGGVHGRVFALLQLGNLSVWVEADRAGRASRSGGRGISRSSSRGAGRPLRIL